MSRYTKPFDSALYFRKRNVEKGKNMFQIFEEEKVISILMFVFLGVSIIGRTFLGVMYHVMIRETDNMATTNNKLLKQCKLKFANCYQLNSGVSNIPVFVDKFINRLAMGPLSFEGMYHLSGQSMLLSVVAAGIGICKSIVDGRMLGEILPFYIACFVGLYLYFSVSSIVDIKGKKRILKVNLVDYLENHLSARIDTTEEDYNMLYGPGSYQRNSGRIANRKATVELMPIGGRLPMQKDNPVPFESHIKDTTASLVTEEELESLLQEFLTISS